MNICIYNIYSYSQLRCSLVRKFTVITSSNARKESRISKDSNKGQHAGKKSCKKEAKINQQRGIKVIHNYPNS